MTTHESNERGYRYPLLLSGCTVARSARRYARISVSRFISTEEPRWSSRREHAPARSPRRSPNDDRRGLPFFAGLPDDRRSRRCSSTWPRRRLPESRRCMNARDELEAIGWPCGRRGHRHPGRGAVARDLTAARSVTHARSRSRTPSRVRCRAQHGARAGRLLPARERRHGDYRHRRAAPMGRPEAAS